MSPPSRSLVQLPVQIRWRMSGFAFEAPGSVLRSGVGGYFAIFVDRAPIGPGQTMKAVANNDPSCSRTPTCPDSSYLADHQIYTTDAPSLLLAQVSPLTSNKARIQLHSLTVVLMDTSGHRIGESAWELDLRIPNAGMA